MRSSPARRPRQISSAVHPLMESAPLRSIGTPPCCKVQKTPCALSWGFFPFCAMGQENPLLTGLPHPLCSAFRFSQPLDGLRLSRYCGLVSYRWHTWGLPFRAFPCQTAVSPLDELCPPVVRRCPPPLLRTVTRAGRRLQGFAPPDSPLPSADGLDRRKTRCSPGVHPL